MVCAEIVEEDSFVSDLVNCRSQIYVKSIVTKLGKELESPSVPTGRTRCMVLLMKTLVHKLIEWINDRTQLDGSTDCDVNPQGFYRFLFVF